MSKDTKIDKKTQKTQKTKNIKTEKGQFFVGSKEKIKLLESEIDKMKQDHALTFGYEAPVTVKVTAADIVLLLVGAAMLITGMVWIFLHYSTESGRTVLKLGNLRFTQAVFCIPLLIGILLLMSGRTGRICKAGVIFTAAGALAAGIAVMIGTVSSDPWYICLIFTVLFLGGMVLFVRNTVKIYKIKQKQKQQEKASAATDLTAKM